MKTLIISLGCLFISSSLAQSPNLRSPNSKERVLTSTPECWRESYGRGVGTSPSGCPSGQENGNSLCYPKCASGYTGVGPVCWQNCPSGYADTGAYCQKPSSYGRGSGYAIWSQGQCQNDNPQGCEQYGALWYPICASGYYAAGCCVCSPSCPSGMTDIGVACQKQSYGRGVGSTLSCPANQDTDASLCYNKCRAGYAGSGPVCWGNCPAGLYQCGALCLSSQAECTSQVLKISLEVVQGVLEVAADIENPVGVAITLAQTGIQVGSDLSQYGMCTNL